MKVPYHWLREYVEIPYSPAELAHRLTMAGIEVGAVQTFAPLDENIVAGRVEELNRHPQVGNLQVVKIDAGQDLLTVVCGAWNMKKGDMVALALPGTVLPGGRKIGVATVQGVLSSGMLCSAGELGLDLMQEEEGILLITEKCSPGDRLIDFLFVNEPVLELDLTPNRADCLGLLGVAREVAAQTGGKVMLPPAEVVENGRDVRELAGVKILEPALCSRFTAKIMEGFTIAPAPLNIQLKLLSVGIRAIDNLVDVTNYVMWETGFPMHAYDYDKLKEGRIVVRRARAGETLTTLDGVLRKLDAEMLVIADARVPVGLAGVMGGENTEITASTTRLLLEVASFNPVSIRRTARRLNLPSEASQRYEKGVDPESALTVQNRAMHLIQKIAGGEICKGVIDEYPKPYRAPQVTLRTQKVAEVLGYPVSATEIEDILGRLELKAEPLLPEKESLAQNTTAGPVYTVNVPSFRRDITLEIDLVEEIARMKGFEHIPVALPRGELTLGRLSQRKRAINRVRETLIGCGLQEMITFSFLNPCLFDHLALPADDERRQAVPLQNPLSEEQGVLRTTLLPNALQVMQYNFNRQTDNQLLFEIGKVFMPALKKQRLPREKMQLVLVLSGKTPLGDWQNAPRPLDYYFLKGLQETLLAALGIENYSWRAEQLPVLHPTRGSRLLIKDQVVGFSGALHPAVQEKFGLKQNVYVAELDLEEIIDAASLTPSFKPLPRFPAVFRDVAFIVPLEVNAGNMLQDIRAYGGTLLEDVNLFDVYAGKQLPPGHRSLAFALTFRHNKKTLQDEEVERILADIEKKFSEKYKASLRKI
ncbi:MAG: phenylalanine--tRNA ligase subunit beta [Firmicutes bacterium]|nr:phenylalanine--tRNA ligase subunit beta [Bacillota bacterium]